MREFNTTATCYPEIHYTVLRKELIKVGKKQVEKGCYFTIFAPRQAGKTTYFELLFNEFTNTNIKSVHIRFASLKNSNREDFYEALDYKLHREIKKHNIKVDQTIAKPLDIEKFFEEISMQSVSILVVIDEFEGIPECVQNEFMHALRDMFHQKKHHALHSLILVGVSSTVELSTSSASPFNVTEEIQIPYFTSEEVDDLIGQYTSETGQKFDDNVIRTIYQNTNGQPGLVCALCKHLVEVVATDKSKSISINDFYTTQKFFLTTKLDKNILNIVSKAKNKKGFMLKLLFSGREIPFTIDDPDISYLYSHGVVDNVDEFVQVPVPMYSKRLMTAFRPLINGEVDYFVTGIHERFDELLVNDEIDVKGILQRYDAYVKRRGFHAFDKKNLKESACHYSLDGYCYFVIERLGGHIFAEVPSGRGRTDILILLKDKKYIIETKIYTDENRFEKGKYQLAQYLKTEELSEGYYVAFSSQHTNKDTLYFEEIIEDKKIYTFIICTNFEVPSKVTLPELSRPEISKPIETERLIRIYIIHDKSDEDNIMDLEDYLFDQGFEIKTLSSFMDELDFAESHQNLLEKCDAFIIYYGDSRQAWLNNKLEELQTLKTSRSFQSAVYVTGKKDKIKERFRTREVDDVIKNFGEFLPDKFNNFVEKIKNMV